MGTETDLGYSIDRYEAEMDAQDYIRGFRRADYFIKLCQECGNYGRRYGCPPFEEDPLAAINRYAHIHIIGVKIVPNDRSLPLKAVHQLMKPVTDKLNEELLAMEMSSGGKAYGFAGSCPYCDGEPCARIDSKPCRHPDKVRPSLEAIGFDISKTAKDVLGLEIKWSKGDVVPEYLTLVCGLFY